MLRIYWPFRRYGNDEILFPQLFPSLSLLFYSTDICSLAFAIHKFAPCQSSFSGQGQMTVQAPCNSIMAIKIKWQVYTCGPVQFEVRLLTHSTGLRVRTREGKRQREKERCWQYLIESCISKRWQDYCVVEFSIWMAMQDL